MTQLPRQCALLQFRMYHRAHHRTHTVATGSRKLTTATVTRHTPLQQLITRSVFSMREEDQLSQLGALAVVAEAAAPAEAPAVPSGT